MWTPHFSGVSRRSRKPYASRAPPRSAAEHVRQQPVVFLLDRAVALAHARLEARAVEDADLAAVVADQPLGLQLAGGFADARALHAEHVGDQLLGHDQLAAGEPV